MMAQVLLANSILAMVWWGVALIVVAVAAVGYGIYRLATSGDDEEEQASVPGGQQQQTGQGGSGPAQPAVPGHGNVPNQGVNANQQQCGGGSAPVPAPQVAVTIAPVVRGNPYVARNATDVGLPKSVPPTKTYEVQVTVTPSLQGGHCIHLDITGGSADNGTATVAPGQITQTTTVTITGGNQTEPGHAGNLKIQAKLNGQTVKATSAGFSVCAHPLNLRNTYFADVNSAGRVGVRVSVRWDSDSGTFNDLDQAERSEVVEQGARNAPPFLPLARVRAVNSHYKRGDSRTIVDRHTIPKPPAGPAGTNHKYQLYIFKCHRCGAVDKTMSNSGLHITHHVFRDGAQWKHKTTKNGESVTIGARSTQAGNANVTSPDHIL